MIEYIKQIKTPDNKIYSVRDDEAYNIANAKIDKTTVASADALGLVKIGYTESGENYPVELDNENKMYVNVPWTDTKNTAGSTNSNSKLFLIGATSQATNPQTYSHDTAYVGTDGCLYSGGSKVLTGHQDLSQYINTLSGAADNGVITDLNKDGQTLTVTSTSLATDSPSANGNALTFIDNISQAANGKITATKKNIPVFTKSGTNAEKGLVPAPSTIAGTTKYLREDGTWQVPPDTNTNTTYTAGTGLSLSGTTFNHSNSIAQGIASEGGSARSLSFDEEFNIPSIAYDEQGHITDIGSTTLTIPSNPNTDTKVTSAENHYTPQTASSSKLSKDASATTNATWGSTALVTGIDIQRDAKGHVTDFSLDSIKLPLLPTMTAATELTAGQSGLVPNAEAGKQNAFLRGDATWTILTPALIGADIAGSAATAEKNAKEHADGLIDALTDGAADTLDTIGEISKALKNNADILDTVLFKTGGTISSPNFAPLIIERTNVNYAAIGFQNSNGVLGYIGMDTQDGNLIKFLSDKNTTNAKTILDSGNYKSYALPLSGGTLTGALSFSAGNAITWKGGSYHQRIKIVDDNTSGTDVFQFSQSSNSGSTWPVLASIQDDGTIVAEAFKGAVATIDTEGLMAPIDKKNVTYFVEGTQTAATGSWTGNLTEVLQPYDGLTIRYYLPYTGSGNASLALNGGEAYPIYRYGTSTRITTHFNAGSIITMTFRTNYYVGGSLQVDSENKPISAWIVDAYYNSDTQMRLYNSTNNVEYPVLTRYNKTTGASYYQEYGRYTTGVTINPSTNTITATTFNGALSGNATTATSATTATTAGKLSSSAGSTTKPVYFSGGIPVECSSELTDYLPLSGGTMEGRLTANEKITLPSTGGQWISGMTLTNPSIQISTQQTESSYHPYFGVKTYSGHIVNLGGLSNNFGFYGYKSGRTANGTDWSFVFDVGTGAITSTGNIKAPTFIGSLSGNAKTATTADKVANSLTLQANGTTLNTFNGSSVITVNFTPSNIGAVSKDGDTITGTLVLSKTQDLSGTADNGPALIVGGARTSSHIEMDSNKIQAKSSGTATGSLCLNNDGGLVTIGSGGLTVQGTITGSLSGNASTATKLATAKTLTTNLASTTAASFDGSGNVSIGVTGILPPANGGTGQSSLKSSANSLLNALDTGSSNPVDNDYYISQYANGGTTTTTYHRRPVSKLWNYMNGKISSVLGLTASNYNGNAATATTATTASKVANALTIQAKGATLNTFNGNAAVTVNLTTANIGAISATSANGYYGMGLPDGTTSNWIRTTSNGIIPYQPDGASALGTSSWPFNNIYGKNIYISNVKLSYDSTEKCLDFTFS